MHVRVRQEIQELLHAQTGVDSSDNRYIRYSSMVESRTASDCFHSFIGREVSSDESLSVEFLFDNMTFERTCFGFGSVTYF
jgi:hypothetical protein